MFNKYFLIIILILTGLVYYFAFISSDSPVSNISKYTRDFSDTIESISFERKDCNSVSYEEDLNNFKNLDK